MKGHDSIRKPSRRDPLPTQLVTAGTIAMILGLPTILRGLAYLDEGEIGVVAIGAFELLTGAALLTGEPLAYYPTVGFALLNVIAAISWMAVGGDPTLTVVVILGMVGIVELFSPTARGWVRRHQIGHHPGSFASPSSARG